MSEVNGNIFYNNGEYIEILRDDNEYYKGLGRNFLSNTDVGVLLSDPRKFRKVSEESKALAEGRLFHQLMLEPEKAVNVPFVDMATRNNKVYKDFCETQNIDFVMLKHEVDEITSLTEVMKGNFNFHADIYREGNKFEEPMIGEIQGMVFKGKADIVSEEYIIDLKTTSDINKFKRSARTYNYDSQCYIYQELFGKPLIFFVIDKLTKQLGVFRPTERFVAEGAVKVAAAIQVYNKYFAEDSLLDVEDHYIDETLDW